MAHAGGDWAFAEEVAECVRRHPNVYAEITYTSVTNGVIEFLVEAAGEDRVVFGSDQPMRDPRPAARLGGLGRSPRRGPSEGPRRKLSDDPGPREDSVSNAEDGEKTLTSSLVRGGRLRWGSPPHKLPQAQPSTW